LSFILEDDVWSKFPNVTRLVEEISSRPAAQRTLATLKGRAFKTEVDAETRNYMSDISLRVVRDLLYSAPALAVHGESSLIRLGRWPCKRRLRPERDVTL
jgi:hypothetical protein